jgi:hypothetical protein
MIVQMQRDSTSRSRHHRIQNGRRIAMQYTYSSPLRLLTTSHGSPSSGTVNSETYQNVSNIVPSNIDHIIRGSEQCKTSVPMAKNDLGNAIPLKIRIATDKPKRKKGAHKLPLNRGGLRLTEFWPQHRLFLASSRDFEGRLRI